MGLRFFLAFGYLNVSDFAHFDDDWRWYLMISGGLITKTAFPGRFGEKPLWNY